MRDDVECPYCGTQLEVNHDDGENYEEDFPHQMQCEACEKEFVFFTKIIFYYDARKADCLNGGEHKWKPTRTFPIEFAQMKCTSCGERRKPTPEELSNIIKNKPCLTKSQCTTSSAIGAVRYRRMAMKYPSGAMRATR